MNVTPQELIKLSNDLEVQAVESFKAKLKREIEKKAKASCLGGDRQYALYEVINLIDSLNNTTNEEPGTDKG